MYTTINYDTEKWHHDYFLVLDDDKVGSSPGAWSFCGPTCTRYTVKVKNKSNADNTVHVGAHTWRNRSYNQNSNCSGALTGKKHSIYMSGDISLYQFENNERWMPPVTLKAQ